MTSEKPLSPQRWAYNLTHILNAAFGADHFPIHVSAIAKEFSHQRFPDDPITMVKGASLPGFEGALYRAPAGKTGWGILYNSDITSTGRKNFTLAHEFGHYLLHRLIYPNGIECREQDIVRWDSEYAQIEHQANVFAATLLMPLDDFRRQIDDRSQPTLDDLGNCASRYDVSLIAATLRWLQYTRRRACLVVSRDGFVLWARSSDRAWKTRAFIKTANRPPVPVPDSSLAACRESIEGSRAETDHDAGVWFPEPCRELVLFADQYDFTISLLHLDDVTVRIQEEELVEDTRDRMNRAFSR